MTLTGCQTMPSADLPSDGLVYHFVAVWLKNPDDASARERIATQTEAWRDFPGVVDVAYGDGLAGERKIVQDYDYGVLLIFESEAALRHYEQDPEHQRAIKEVLAPLAAKVQVFDFVAPEGTTGGLSRSELRKRQYRHYAVFASD